MKAPADRDPLLSGRRDKLKSAGLRDGEGADVVNNYWMRPSANDNLTKDRFGQ